MNTNQWKERLDQAARRACEAAAQAGDAAKAGAAKAAETAETVVTTAKLRFAIAELQGEKNRQLKRVGELVYATHAGQPTDSETLDRCLTAIDNLNREIRKREGELQERRGVAACPTCGAENPLGSAFCGNCGQSMAP